MMKYGTLENSLLYCIKKWRLRSSRLQEEHVLMIAMKMMKSLISRLRPCALKTKILVNTDVFFATRITTIRINV